MQMANDFNYEQGNGLYLPDSLDQNWGSRFPNIEARKGGSPSTGSPSEAASTGGSDEQRPLSPPPDLPSLFLQSRIVYLGMPIVPAVTELIVAELLYLQYRDENKPMYLYINSTGTTRAGGETVAFETEGTCIYDTMQYLNNEIHTVGVGMAMGQSCMLLAAGHPGKRFMLEHASAMLNQPRVPPTGQRQAIELHIKWKEVAAQKKAYIDILARHTNKPSYQIEQDTQRALYMRPKDAIAYGIIDKEVHASTSIAGQVEELKGA